MKPILILQTLKNSNIARNDFIFLLEEIKVNYEICEFDEETNYSIENYSSLIIFGEYYPKPLNLSNYGVAYKNKLNQLITSFLDHSKTVFLEYFGNLDGLELSIFGTESIQLRKNRLIIKDEDVLTDGLEVMSLLEPHKTFILKPRNSDNYSESELMNIESENDLKIPVVIGRVTGNQKAVYGFPKQLLPVIITRNESNLILSAIRLSEYLKDEFKPAIKWVILILNLIKKLVDPSLLGDEKLNFNSSIKKYKAKLWNAIQKKKDELSSDGVLEPDSLTAKIDESILKTLDWYLKSGVLLNNARPYETNENIKIGDDVSVAEGYNTDFDYTRKRRHQYLYYEPKRISRRGDCTVDSGSFFYFCSKYLQQTKFEISNEKTEITDYIGKYIMKSAIDYWQHDDLSICRGFWSWFDDHFTKYQFYADDTGRCTYLYSIFALQRFIEQKTKKIDAGNYSFENAALPNSEELMRRALSGVIALFQTHGKNGHRFTSIHLPMIYRHGGRKWFRKHSVKRIRYKSPHYEANTYAALIYGYYLTHDEKLLNIATKGIDDYMSKFPKFHIEHSINDDFSKLLVACALLYGVTKNDKHLSYMKQIVDYISNIAEPFGAVPEQDPFHLRGRFEKTNEVYGKMESSVYISNSDSISDQLYSSPFLALGLYFAYKTGVCPEAFDLFKRLISFLAAIQIKSDNPEINGAWMRGFDYSLWDYYGGNGDSGWGAYCIETGWMVSLIGLVMLMFRMDFNPFQLNEIQDEKLRNSILNEISAIYKKEFKVHQDLEKNWKKNTVKKPSRKKWT